ncbi:hypothetical protein LX36DRAFT_349166 [Colletotrichum falcatum]|nr:hypothetical protein LX36DRAFT_349166 [Colletotrichum falcatum]
MGTSLLARSSRSCLLLQAAVTKELYMILGLHTKSWERVWIFDRSMRFWSKGGGFFHKSWARTASRTSHKTTRSASSDICLFFFGVCCWEMGGLGKGWEVFCSSIPHGFPDNWEPDFCRAVFLFFCFCVLFFFRPQSFPSKGTGRVKNGLPRGIRLFYVSLL